MMGARVASTHARVSIKAARYEWSRPAGATRGQAEDEQLPAAPTRTAADYPHRLRCRDKDIKVNSIEVSPDHYLRLRRLTLARAALRSAEGRGTPVEQVAAAHGFWDAEVFRREYRDVFGEAPSLAFRRGAE